MLVTLSGIVISVSDEQPRKASYPTLVTPSGTMTEVSDEQPKNALSPMLVTLLGIVISVSDERPRNASSAITLVPFLIVTLSETKELVAIIRQLLIYIIPLLQ